MVDSEDERTPLQQKLDEFAQQLSKVLCWSMANTLPLSTLLQTAIITASNMVFSFFFSSNQGNHSYLYCGMGHQHWSFQ